MKQSTAMLTLFVLLSYAGPVPAMFEDSGTDAEQLVQRYEHVWNDFVEAFQTQRTGVDRLKLIEEYSQKANAVFADHLTGKSIRLVLPHLERARLLKLEPTFLAVVSDHDDSATRAQALLSLGHYLGNNRRFEECDVTLSHLARVYKDLPHRGRQTFGETASQFQYFYKHLAVGRVAPATAGEDVDGSLFRLTDYQGKVVMLRFWGNWCGPCRAMYPYERGVVKKYQNRPFALIGVNSDPKDECRAAQVEDELVWRSFWDGGTTTGPIARLYQVTNWPTIVVIDAQGVIRARTTGLDREYLTNLLDRLIAEAEAGDSKAS